MYFLYSQMCQVAFVVKNTIFQLFQLVRTHASKKRAQNSRLSLFVVVNIIIVSEQIVLPMAFKLH